MARITYELVVLRDDPNGQVFEVVSVDGNTVTVRSTVTLEYEDCLLENAPECPLSTDGKHKPDPATVTIAFDGHDCYFDVNCSICGLSGCAGKFDKNGVTW